MCGGMGGVNPYQNQFGGSPYGPVPFGGANPSGGANPYGGANPFGGAQQPYGPQPFPGGAGFTPSGIQPPGLGGDPKQQIVQILQSLIQMLQKMLGINPQQQQPGQGLPGQANQQAGNGAASASAAANGGSAAASAAASSSTVITLPPGFDLSKIQVYQNGQQQPLNLTQNQGNPGVPWAPGQYNPYSGGGTPPCHQQQSQFPGWPQVPGPQLV